MFRRILITDAEDKTIEMEIYPEQNNLIKTTKYEIDITLRTRQALTTFLNSISALMDGNTINKVEIEEETE